MRKSYEFYNRELNLSRKQTVELYQKLLSFENYTCSENDVRALDGAGLKMCIAEGKYDLFEKLVSPIRCLDDNCQPCYKYLVDPLSNGIVEYIDSCPVMIDEAYSDFCAERYIFCQQKGLPYYPPRKEDTMANANIILPSDKRRLKNAIYALDLEKVMNMKIGDIHSRRSEGTGYTIKCDQDVLYCAELPCFHPCLDLFHKNIKTLSNDTDAVYEDCKKGKIHGKARVIIDYESLSDENKIAVEALIQNGAAEILEDEENDQIVRKVDISVDCSKFDTVREVNERLLSLTKIFGKQDVLYAKFTHEQLKNDQTLIAYLDLVPMDIRAQVKSLWNNADPKQFARALKYLGLDFYYDEDDDIFYRDIESYKRHQDFIVNPSQKVLNFNRN